MNLKQKLAESRFFKGEAPVKQPITLSHRRIYILPSRRGLAFAVVLLLLLLIAFVYNNNLVYLLTFALASVYFVSILHCFKSLSGLKVSMGRSSPVFAGEQAHFDLLIDNPAPWARTKIHCRLAQPEFISVPPQVQMSWTLAIASISRGWLALPTVTLASFFPFGWFRAWSPLRFDVGVWVYPKPWPKSVPFPDASADSAADQGHKHRGADDFYGLAEYRPGDSIKHIHWQSYAKGAGVFVKQYSGLQSRELWLDYQAVLNLPLEDRLSLLCRWLLDAQAQGLQFGLRLPGFERPPGQGELHLQACLQALAKF